jgi:hypothetical protein
VTHADTARQRAAPLGSRAQTRSRKRALTRLFVAALAFGFAVLGSADGALRTLTGAAGAKPTAEIAGSRRSPL